MRYTLTAVLAKTLYCSRTRSRSASLGILKRVMRSMGAILREKVAKVLRRSTEIFLIKINEY